MLNMPKLYRTFPGYVSGQKRADSPAGLRREGRLVSHGVNDSAFQVEDSRQTKPDPDLWHGDRMTENAMSQNASHSSKRATTMQTAIASNQVGRFPVIQFRKKRLTVAIHTHFDMQNAEEVNEVKQLVEQALAQLAEDGDVKVSYALSDV